MTTEMHFSLSEYICLSSLPLYCSSELQGGNAATKYFLKKHFALVSFRQQGRSHNESNHSEAKMEIFVSELIRQGISHPK